MSLQSKLISFRNWASCCGKSFGMVYQKKKKSTNAMFCFNVFLKHEAHTEYGFICSITLLKSELLFSWLIRKDLHPCIQSTCPGAPVSSSLSSSEYSNWLHLFFGGWPSIFSSWIYYSFFTIQTFTHRSFILDNKVNSQLSVMSFVQSASEPIVCPCSMTAYLLFFPLPQTSEWFGFKKHEGQSSDLWHQHGF